MKIEVNDDEYRLILTSIFHYALHLQMVHLGHTYSLMEPERVDAQYKDCRALYKKFKALESKTK